eukprot:1156440-Pelagomonas_calceolata.AAC.5
MKHYVFDVSGVPPSVFGMQQSNVNQHHTLDVAGLGVPPSVFGMQQSLMKHHTLDAAEGNQDTLLF